MWRAFWLQTGSGQHRPVTLLPSLHASPSSTRKGTLSTRKGKHNHTFTSFFLLLEKHTHTPHSNHPRAYTEATIDQKIVFFSFIQQESEKRKAFWYPNFSGNLQAWRFHEIWAQCDIVRVEFCMLYNSLVGCGASAVGCCLLLWIWEINRYRCINGDRGLGSFALSDPCASLVMPPRSQHGRLVVSVLSSCSLLKKKIYYFLG